MTNRHNLHDEAYSMQVECLREERKEGRVVIKGADMPNAIVRAQSLLDNQNRCMRSNRNVLVYCRVCDSQKGAGQNGASSG